MSRTGAFDDGEMAAEMNKMVRSSLETAEASLFCYIDIERVADGYVKYLHCLWGVDLGTGL